LPEIEGYDHNAASGESFVDGFATRSVKLTPRAAVEFDDAWEGPFSPLPEYPGKERLILMQKILDVLKIEFKHSHYVPPQSEAVAG